MLIDRYLLIQRILVQFPLPHPLTRYHSADYSPCYCYSYHHQHLSSPSNRFNQQCCYYQSHYQDLQLSLNSGIPASFPFLVSARTYSHIQTPKRKLFPQGILQPRTPQLNQACTPSLAGLGQIDEQHRKDLLGCSLR